VDRLEPGTCADGSAARIKYTPRPHGNHNPQYGGQFFMAPDNWHHLEGVYPRAGVFELHVYDDYSRPLPNAELRRVSGNVSSAAGDAPLTMATSGDVLEARVASLGFPAQITAKVRFTPGGAEHRFDFTFDAYSHAATADRSPAPDSARPSASAEGAAAVAGLTSAEILERLNTRSRELAAIIGRGAYGELYVPAFAAKDLALALDARSADAPPRVRADIDDATSRLLRAAWMLDAAGDAGNADDIKAAHSRFLAALGELNAAAARLPK
jgi:hypothetical protein